MALAYSYLIGVDVPLILQALLIFAIHYRMTLIFDFSETKGRLRKQRVWTTEYLIKFYALLEKALEIQK